MNWYYVDAGQQAGPVDEAQLTELVRSGKIQPETLIWREGMANWEPYHKVPLIATSPATPAPAPPPPPSGASPGKGVGVEDAPPTDAVCSECGKMFPIGDMIKHKSAYICAGCKPVFFQRLSESGTYSGGGVSGMATEADLLTREYDVDIGGAMSRAWEVFTQNVGLMLGGFILMALVFVVGWVVSIVISMVVPFGNYFVTALYAPPIAGGALWFYLRLLRGQPATIGDAFMGFSAKYGQLALFGLVQMLINLLCMLPLFLVLVGFGLSSVLMGGGGGGQSQIRPEMLVGFIAAMVIVGGISMCALAYVNTLLLYAIPLIMDKNYPFWPAMKFSRRMVARRWWMTFLFLVVGSIISSLGMLACLIGALVTFPLYIGMKAAVYDRNFRDLMYHH